MTTRVNLIIAKRGREDHLGACLHFLNQANTLRAFDIVAYVIDEYSTESQALMELPRYGNLTVRRIKVAESSDKFNKSRLLNTGLFLMRDEYDWVSIIDVDMLYVPNFYNAVHLQLVNSIKGKAVCVCKGYSLDTSYSNNILGGKMELPDGSSILRYNGNSQISLTKSVVELIYQIYSDMYCETFEGWGGEDSDMSFRLRDLAEAGLIHHHKLRDMWYHLCHPKQSDDGTNKRLFERRRERNKKTLMRWINDKIKYCGAYL